MQYVAHYGEIHRSLLEAAWHFLTADWYIAVPGAVVLLVITARFIAHRAPQHITTSEKTN